MLSRAAVAPAGSGHPWTGWTVSAGLGSREKLNVTLVEPEPVVELSLPGITAALTAAGHGDPADA